MTESFAELFEQSLSQAEMRPGSIIRGTVVDIGPDVVVVNAGLKSEGVVPKWQFLDADGQLEVNVGDTVECTLELLEDGLGATLLSRDKAKRLKAWTDLERHTKRTKRLWVA
jgi:small subunit ribosomal protein S1